MTGLVVLVAGYLLVTFHNVWVSGWTVLITIIGWIAFIKGLFALLLPEQFVKIAKLKIKKSEYLTLCAIITVILGAIMGWQGFFV
ncbi:MAG: hypothetical protein ABIG10_03170 [bacterium]